MRHDVGSVNIEQHNWGITNKDMLGRFLQRSRKTAMGPPGETLYAIGDVHGRADLLQAMISRIAAEPCENPKRCVFLGDYVDRGPDSSGVLDQLVQMGRDNPSTVFLKGNHEAALLDFMRDPDRRDGWLDWGGVETLLSYGVEAPLAMSPQTAAAELRERLPASHLEFLSSLKLTYEAGDYFFAHAGVRPGVELAEQKEGDLLWIREAFHNAPENARPAKTVVHGHHPTKRPVDAGWRIGVDTGAVWSGALTAVEIDGPNRRFLKVVE